MEPIDLKTAKQMVANYGTTRKKLIDDAYKINDTASLFIPIDQLKEFVNQLPAEATGVRVHLAAYNTSGAAYPNQTTAVFVGTIAGAAGNVDAVKDDEAIASTPGFGPWNKSQPCPPDCY